jgi:nitrogen regulatory protein P-II 1
MRFKVVIALVTPELTKKLVDTAREAGATGDVIIKGKGSGMHEPISFLGLNVMDQTNLVMFLVEEHVASNILDALNDKCKLDDPGNGIAFSLNVERAVGLALQMEKFRQQAKDKYY